MIKEHWQISEQKQQQQAFCTAPVLASQHRHLLTLTSQVSHMLEILNLGNKEVISTMHYAFTQKRDNILETLEVPPTLDELFPETHTSEEKE